MINSRQNTLINNTIAEFVDESAIRSTSHMTNKVFYNESSINSQKLREIADFGDILLFSGNQTFNILTRTVTRSEFDHVAMVLKFETDPSEIFLFESTQQKGVSVVKWSSIENDIGPNKFYRHCVFRHVEFDRNEKCI